MAQPAQQPRSPDSAAGADHMQQTAAAAARWLPSSAKAGAKSCANCLTSDTPLWRKDPVSGTVMCNACGIYYKNHGYHRPLQLIDAAVGVRVSPAACSPSGDDGDATDVELSAGREAPSGGSPGKSSSGEHAQLEAAGSDDGSAQYCSGPENSGGEGGVSGARRSSRHRIARAWGDDISGWSRDSDEDASDDEGSLAAPATSLRAPKPDAGT